MRYIVSLCLLLTVLFGSVGVHAFGKWQAEGSSYDILEEAIFDLEQDIKRAIESRSASPAFLDALEEHVVQLYSVLAQLQDEAEPVAEYREETPAGMLTVGSRSEYVPPGYGD